MDHGPGSVSPMVYGMDLPPIVFVSYVKTYNLRCSFNLCIFQSIIEKVIILVVFCNVVLQNNN